MKTKKPDKTMSIVGLCLNIFIMPGLGTLIGGGKERVSSGVIQLILWIISFPLMFVLIGFPLAFGVWIWALVTMIKAVQAAE